MNHSKSTQASFAIEGLRITDGRVLEIAPENPRQEISPINPKVFDPVERKLTPGDQIKYNFPARSVNVVELDCRSA